MFYWTVMFLVIAIIAGLLGFGAVAFVAADIARICFFVFLVLFLAGLVTHMFRRVFGRLRSKDATLTLMLAHQRRAGRSARPHLD
jgi:uncharacterized membrane protein YtjA (UPF0391 family)